MVDSMVERINQTLKDIQSKLVNANQKDWDTWIPQALLAYRSTVHSLTGFSPHALMFGREASILIDLMVPNPPLEPPLSTTKHIDSMRHFEEAYEITRENTRKAGKHYKDYYDVRSSDATYNVGDKVWLYVPNVKKGNNFKISRPWQGPYVIVKKLSEVVYRIELQENKRKRLVVHMNRLKKCCISPDSRQRIPTTQLSSLEEESQNQTESVDNTEVPEVPDNSTDDDEDEGWTIVTYHRRNARNETNQPVTEESDLQQVGTTESTCPNVGNDQITNDLPQSENDKRNDRPRRTRRKPAWLKNYR